MSSEQPTSTGFSVSGLSVFLMHLPNLILPYCADVTWITCPCVQLALNVSQLQYSLLKPRNQRRNNVLSPHMNSSSYWNLTCLLWLPMGFPFDQVSVYIRMCSYFMISSKHPMSTGFNVSGLRKFLMHLPNFILPYLAAVMCITCPCVQFALKVSQLQYSLTNPKEGNSAVNLNNSWFSINNPAASSCKILPLLQMRILDIILWEFLEWNHTVIFSQQVFWLRCLPYNVFRAAYI